MKISIHQPEHLVWLGLLYKIDISDAFVLLDDVQFTKNNFQNRNKIRIKDGFLWLTVPIKNHNLNTPIRNIQIADDPKWRVKYLNTIRMNYGRTPYFNEYFPKIENIINKNHTLVMDLNLDLLHFALEVFNIHPKEIIFSSKFGLNTKRTEMLVDICKHTKASHYISGSGGKVYLDTDLFSEHGINVEFVAFHAKEYNQIHGGFIPGMSFIDYLFNIGPVLPWKK